MTQIAQLVLNGQVVAPDILVGGTPCHSFSIAGARQGLSDPRGALTLKYVELANVIDQTRQQNQRPPATIIWENVPGVLSASTANVMQGTTLARAQSMTGLIAWAMRFCALADGIFAVITPRPPGHGPALLHSG